MGARDTPDRVRAGLAGEAEGLICGWRQLTKLASTSACTRKASVSGATSSTWPVAGTTISEATSPASRAFRVSPSPSSGGAIRSSLPLTLTNGTPTGTSRAGEVSASGSGRSALAGPVSWS